MKYYAVKVGYVPGIYMTWNEAKEQVNSYPYAKYKSFQTYEEAKAFMNDSENFIHKNTEIIAYTDGSEKDGIGGYGVVLLYKDKYPLQFYGKIILPEGVTNNISEFIAVANALYNSKGSITIYTDSEYVRNSLTTWIHKWLTNGWLTSDNKPVKNKELIESVYSLMQEREVIILHVEAHKGNKYNEIADKLADKGRLSLDNLLHVEVN